MGRKMDFKTLKNSWFFGATQAGLINLGAVDLLSFSDTHNRLMGLQ